MNEYKLSIESTEKLLKALNGDSIEKDKAISDINFFLKNREVALKLYNLTKRWLVTYGGEKGWDVFINELDGGYYGTGEEKLEDEVRRHLENRPFVYDFDTNKVIIQKNVSLSLSSEDLKKALEFLNKNLDINK